MKKLKNDRKNSTTRTSREIRTGSHHDLEIIHAKTTKLSSHNLKYERKLNFKNNFNFKINNPCTSRSY